MICEKIDLYDYFKLKRPENGVGYLYTYVLNNTEQIKGDRKHPAMLVIPGGGYSMTSDREAEPVAMAYVGKGFNAFVLRYSCAPVKYPYPLLEAVMAMNYIRLNAEKLNVDTQKIAAVGFSAGGHLCAMLGSYYDSPEVAEIFKGNVSARPDAVILSYPVITCGEKAHKGSFINLCGEDNVKLMEKLDIANLVNANSAPAFIWATYTDGCVPVKNSLIVADAYEKAGVPFSVHIWGKGQHGISLADINVYNNYDQLKDSTPSIHTWVELSIEWLTDLGIRVE